MALRDNLKRIREQHGINGKEFAQKIGLNYSTYMTYETTNQQKARWPNEDTLLKIAAALGVSVDELLGYSVLRTDEYKRYKEWLESYDYDIEEKQGGLEVFYHDPNDEMPFNDLDKPARFQSKEEFCRAIRKALKRAEHNTEYNKICFVYAMLDDKQMFSE